MIKLLPGRLGLGANGVRHLAGCPNSCGDRLKPRVHWFRSGDIAAFIILLLALFLAGCSDSRAAEARSAAATATANCAPATEEAAICAPALQTGATPTPAGRILPQSGPVAPSQTTSMPEGTPSSTPLSTPSPISTPQSPISTLHSPTPQSPVSNLQSPTPCPPDLCIYSDRLVLARPIQPPGRVTIDTSYRFGSTQDGLRDPHHGVEFLNSHGTPVLAAASGEVVVAADDRQIFYGPYSYFYGNLVVLKHALPGLSQPLYTLYGHLSKILVEQGDRVETGQEIGEVGMSGVATGSHLHFEIRWGQNDYKNSINPEIWLAPLQEDGRLMGALAGRILDPQENSLPAENIVIEHLPAPGQASDFAFYLKTYEEKTLVGLPPYEESYAIGDLPAGWYRISFVQSGMQSHLVQVLPGQLTVVTLRVK